MLVIINGYVSLSQLHTQFYYIIAVDLGASIGWGLIDGFTYVMAESIDRGTRASLLRKIQSDKNLERSIDEIVEELDDTFLGDFSPEGKRNIAAEVLKNSSLASIGRQRFITREDLAGLISIIGIYLTAELSFPSPTSFSPTSCSRGQYRI